MNDFIRKTNLVAAFRKSPAGIMLIQHHNIDKFIMAQPCDEDVVQIVRCKECKCWDRDNEYCVKFLTQDKNGYCSWWERREDAEIH